MRSYKGDIFHNIQEELENIKVQNMGLICTPASRLKYEVNDGNYKSVVDLDAQICICRKWYISGIPCKHALSAIFTNRHQAESYVHMYHSKETYLLLYHHVIVPVPSQDERVKTDLPNIHPPIIHKPASRPKKRRIRGVNEPGNPFKMTRVGGPITCGNCNKQGHNSRSC